MYLKWGSYTFDDGACKIATSGGLVFNEGGQPLSQRRRVDVDGYLSANGQVACTLAMSALETALARQYQDLILYNDDGSVSATALLNSSSISGVRVVSSPSYPDWKGNERNQFVRFTFAVEAEYPLSNTQNMLVSFRERLSFSGGGPRRVVMEALDTLPQTQTVRLFTAYQVIQQGQAVGYRATPAAPQSIWPDALMESPNFDYDSPTRAGGFGSVPAKYKDFFVSWRYLHKSPTPLTGSPSLWL